MNNYQLSIQNTEDQKERKAKLFAPIRNSKFVIPRSDKRGAAMMISVIIFLLGSLAIVLGIVTPAVREFNIAETMIKSRQSYFIAESGVEDALYRIKVGKQISSTENLVLGSASTATTITALVGGDKEIISLGDFAGRKRHVKTILSTGTGASFAYGVQTGNGGFTVGENATVNGNIYANGPITGANNAVVTGSAFSANSALVVDQSNTLPTSPPNSIVFGNSGSTQDVAQGFQVTTNGPLSGVSLYLKKTGIPGNLTVRITGDTGGSPNTTTIASGIIVSALVSSSYGWVDVTFTEKPQLVPGQSYWIVIDSATGSGLLYYTLGANTLYALGQAKVGQYSGSWSATTPSGLDGYFSVSQGNVFGSITNIEIGTGTTGDARAHSVTASEVRGGLYCQVDTGNTDGSGLPKSCDTSQADPTPEDFPITDANILEWKNDALAGGTISGDYNISTNVSLGPKKIEGNLTMDNNETLTITGTLWVTGNIILSNGAILKLDAGYGGSSGIIIADGIIDLSNNVDASGSGQSGSYIMLLTTSTCPAIVSCSGSPALSLENNGGSAILNAQYGTMTLSNNARTKEAVAYGMVLTNNTVVTYESGLANVNFAAGPSGSWKIKSWKEIE